MDCGRLRFLVLTLAVAGAPATVVACEPILPLTHLMSGSNVVGPLFILKSVTWLAIAVAIKSLVFVFFERRLPWRSALLFMFVANLLSTIPGVLASVFAGTLALIALPMIFFFGLLAQRRMMALKQQSGDPTPKLQWVAFAFTFVYFASLAMFGMASAVADARHAAQYWFLKFAFTTSAVLLGLAISTVLEEYAMARLTRKSYGALSFYAPVLRANYVTLGIVLFAAAAQMLPRRLASPGFLVSWFHSLSSFLEML